MPNTISKGVGSPDYYYYHIELVDIAPVGLNLKINPNPLAKFLETAYAAVPEELINKDLLLA